MRKDRVECTLGEIFNITYGKGLPIKKLTDEGFPVFGANGVIGYYSEYKYKDEQVLISCRGAASGTINMSPKECFVTNNSLIVEIGEKVSLIKKYLYFMLSGANRSKIITGSAQPQVTINNAITLIIPIAPLPEQRAIVVKIEELFSSLDSGIADLKKAQEQLKIYRQAVLKKAFEGELTKEWRAKQTNLPKAEELLEQIKVERQNHYNQQIKDWEKALKTWNEKDNGFRSYTKPKKWKDISPLTEEEKKNLFKLQQGISWRKIGETCVVKGGKRLPKGHSFSKEETSYSYIMAGNLKDGTVAKQVNFIKEETYNALYHYRVDAGNVYITIVGACIGDAGVVPEFHHLSILTENAAKIITTKSLFSKYLAFWLNSLVAQIRIKENIFSATLGKLALSRIEELEFPFCSLQEQHQIVQEIESRLSVCDKVEESIVESLEKSKALRQSILKKAFEGRLLNEQELAACKATPDYEPASVLLERIKKEKASSNKSAVVKKNK